MTLAHTIHDLSNELFDHTIAIRRQLHANPELSYQEFETAKLVCSELDRLGIPYEHSPVKPGIIATIDSGKPGKLLVLRGDMDALPIQEDNELPFISQHANVMHACGHDVHTANLLAVGEMLVRLKDSWSGRARLVFQPAEENGGGGREMIKAGMFEEVPDACFALHVENDMPGRVLATKRYLTAYSDSFSITIHGKAAHSSTPGVGVDAIYIAAQVTTALHGMVSRNIDPMERATINVGTIKGGSAINIICDKVELGVMLRNLSKESRDIMLEQVPKIVNGICETLGGSAEIAFRAGYPAVFNDEDFTQFVIETLQANTEAMIGDIAPDLGPEYVLTNNDAVLGAEDFGFFAQHAPSCMVWVGVAKEASKHSPGFMIDEPYIKLCMRSMTLVAATYLSQP